MRQAHYMGTVITPTAAILTHAKFMLLKRGQDPLAWNARFPALPSAKSARAGMVHFSFLAITAWTSLKSHYPSLLPYMSHNGRMTARECEFQGKGMSIFRIVFLFYLYHISLVNCIQYFEMKNEDRGAHTLSHIGFQIAGYWACV